MVRMGKPGVTGTVRHSVAAFPAIVTAIRRRAGGLVGDRVFSGATDHCGDGWRSGDGWFLPRGDDLVCFLCGQNVTHRKWVVVVSDGTFWGFGRDLEAAVLYGGGYICSFPVTC